MTLLVVLVAVLATALAGPITPPRAAPRAAPGSAPHAAPGSAPHAAPGPAAVTAAERACLDDLKLLYPGDGKCYQLLSTGPCKSHEWLVLDSRATDKLRPLCARVPCAEREVLWPKDGRCYQRFRDRETLCPHPGNLLVSNPFGLGECACMRTPPHARDPQQPSACYPLFSRGPCPEGQLLVPKTNATADQGVCARDPCQQQPGSTASMVLWPVSAGGDGRCHPLGSTEVCPEQSWFGIHPHTLRPGCIGRVNHLLPPTPCSGDRCAPTNTASYSDGYIKELLQAHKAHKAQKRAG